MTTPLTLPAMILAAGLFLAPATAAAAQPRPAAPRPADPAPIVMPDERSAQDTRQRLRETLEQYPPSVAQVLRLDPSLLNKADYLASYPALAAFLAQHSEVAHNPVFFLGDARFNGGDGTRKQALDSLENIFTGGALLVGLLSLLGAIVWLLRSVINHRRWLRATKIQTDAHGKIVDRLTSHEDLLAYLQSSAGQRFLSASAVTIDASPQAVSAPLNRILWSVQAGVVIATVGTGLWFSKNTVIEEVAQPLQVMAILAISLGVGFIVSALVSYALSRQLGLVQAQPPNA